MSESTQTTQRLAGPRWLLGGVWRRRWMRARVSWAFAPVIALVVGVVAVGLSVGWVAAAGTALAGVAATLSPAGRRWLAPRWWLLRWHWDARAAGLSVEAEPNVFAGTDGPLDRRVVVVPSVRVTVHGNGSRTYRCRFLPGQTLADYEAAVPRLVTRWAVVAVHVEYELGRRHVYLNVHRSAPAPVSYERAA